MVLMEIVGLGLSVVGLKEELRETEVLPRAGQIIIYSLLKMVVKVLRENVGWVL
jgi:hypothetical protein